MYNILELSNMKLQSPLKLLFMLFIINFSPTYANVIRIPIDYQSIQEGINAAQAGDTILVSPGTYYENINFESKSIIVKSTAGYDQTTIHGPDSSTVIYYKSYENLRPVIEGFKITNGEIGIISVGSITIKNNWIVNNSGSGILVRPWRLIPYPIITGNIIENNQGSGILIGTTSKGPSIPTISNNIIKGNNNTGIMIMGTWSYYSKDPSIFNNLIFGNNIGIIIMNKVNSAKYADVSICDNTIVDNSGYGVQAIWAAPIIRDCIIWNNNNDLSFTLVSSSTLVMYSDIKDGDYSSMVGNISSDPLFVDGQLGAYYLSHINAGQNQQSPCIDSGSLPAVALGLQSMTTRTDEAFDADQVDMGYHYRVSTPTNVEEIELAIGGPESYKISQNYPNPFNPLTTIQYIIPNRTYVKLNILNLSGQLVNTLVSEFKSAGIYNVSWDGTDFEGQKVPSGMYFYKMKAGEFVYTRRMLLIK